MEDTCRDRGARQAEPLRKKHIHMEKDTVREKQSLLQEAKDAKEACEEKKRLHKIQIVENLKAHHGPCSTSDEVLKMLQTYPTRKDLTRAMKG